MRISREKLFAAIISSVSTLIVLGLCEISLRMLLFSDSLSFPAVRQAWRYADGIFEDDYWKLMYLFEGDRDAIRAGVFDQMLGWVPRSGSGNSLKIITDKPYDLESVRTRPVLFYGDSFVAGVTAIEHRIPQVLDRLLPNRPVLNYGVSGYGLDQIYLRYISTAGEFDQPLVLIGILTRDLDRSVLKIRGGQKPYFELDDDQIVLRNSPISTTLQEFVDNNPPTIKSYFGRFVMFRLRSLIPENWFNYILGYDEVHRDKLVINRAILREFDQSSSALSVPVCAVIFYSWEELHKETWREGFLKNAMDELGMAYLDTKPLIQQYISETATVPYDHGHGHLNKAGNELVASQLAYWLAEGNCAL